MSRIFTVSFASVYPHYVAKVEKKGRTQAELDQAIEWAHAARPHAPDLSPLDWPQIARQTLDLYRAAVAGSSPKALPNSSMSFR